VAASWVHTDLNADGMQVDPPRPTDHVEERWYAVSTSPRHEKWVACQLRGYEIDCFLPLYKSLRRWKDRRKELELPLFPGYLFVHIALKNRLQVLRIPGVTQLVGASGRPVPLREQEIEALRKGLASGMYAEAHSCLKIGRQVLVTRGPLTGAQGILTRKKQNCRIVISIDAIMRSVALEIDEADVQPMPRSYVRNRTGDAGIHCLSAASNGRKSCWQS
jgi:transcription antitermination factor NusG